MDGWGSKVISQLSRDLRNDYPDVKGFSETNLKLMRRFYSFYSDLGTSLVPKLSAGEIGHQPGTQLTEAKNTFAMSNNPEHALPPAFTFVPWRQHVEIVRYAKSLEEATFYIEKTVEYGWSREDLIDCLKKDLYHSQRKAVTNFTSALPDPQSNLASETLKDPYNFDFIALTKGYKEKELEDALAENITQVLLELGQGFAYVGRQVRMQVGDTEVYADLLFYHLKLRCFVVVELKATAFKADYLGQLGLYVSAVNHLMKTEVDNPTIGLLICKTKDNVVAEWALESSSQPIGISAFELTELMPKEFESKLPSIEEIEAKLKEEE